jgi:hypothetical protein
VCLDEGTTLSKKRSDVSKRGQITLFMIIGVVVVIAAGLIFMFSNVTQNRAIEQDVKIITEKVSNEFTPIQGYVDKCLYALGKEAVIKAGQQGGYVDSENLIANPVSPTDGASNSLLFFPGDPSYKVAYWWYMDSSNICDEGGQCTFSTNRPDLTDSPNSIEGQIEKYIEDNIDVCLSNFRTFTQAGYSVETSGKPKADVTIARSSVVLELEYQMAASKRNRNQDLTRFVIELPINLRKIYDMATVIANGEGSQRYLERQALNLVSVFSGTRDGAVFPPVSDMTLFTDSEPKYWTRTEVKNQLTTLLTNYVPMVQIVQAGNFNRVEVENEIAQAIFDMMLVQIDEELDTTEYRDYAVEFDYKGWWSPYLKIGNSELLGPSSISGDNSNPLLSGVMSMFKIQNYKFAYDFSYPVLVRVFDPLAFNNEGYTFFFALESNVRNNFPMNTSGTLSLSSSFVESLFCNENQRLSGNFTFNFKDGQGNYLDGARVTYRCGSQVCHIGDTKSEPFVTTLPLCVGGQLSVTHEDHVPVSYNLTVSADESDTIDIISEKYRTVKIDAKKFKYVKGSIGWAPVSTPSDLSQSELAMLSFNLQGATADSGLNFVTMVKSGEELPEVKLVPGRYDVQGNLMLELPAPDRGLQRVVIAEKEVRENCFLGNCRTEYTLPEIPFDDMFPEGGVYLDDAHGGAWEVTASELDNADTITFYLIASPGSSFENLEHQDLEEMSKIEFYSLQERSTLEPVIS